jgi:nitrate/nitrite transport system substrate-binding protein
MSSAPTSTPRRNVLRSAAMAGTAIGLSPLVAAAAYAQGSDKPEIQTVRIGFIPLTDCASIVMASVLGFDKKYGITIVPTKEASWAGVRDKLSSGEIDMAHALYGLVYGMHMGVTGPARDMGVLMTLNQNGQGITLSKKLAEQGVTDAASLAKHMAATKREFTFAQTFPTGTHAMWLYYWMAAAGINPTKDVKVITVAPPQMVANMRVGNMDGYCVGEPWNHRAIIDGIGISGATTQDIWKDHPEKVLGATGDFIKKHPNTTRAVIMAVLDASRWIDASLQNKMQMAQTIAEKAYVNTAVDAISPRILGRYQNGLGKTWDDPNPMRFFNDGSVNYPYLSDGMWFMTQFKRWGLIKAHPDYAGVARAVQQTALYKQAASAVKVGVPSSDVRSSTLMDGVAWRGSDPAAYADSFKVRASSTA